MNFITNFMKTEFDQKTLDIRRVTRVVAGGKRFSFRTAIVVGNHDGQVGIGLANGLDVASSIDKAVRDAKKNLILVPRENQTIPYEVEAKFSSARVIFKPAKIGRGIIAGGPVRIVCELAGVENVTAKILSKTKNKLNNALAAIEAFKILK
ncbi:30S ribosomal protein S5 [Candidatus Azambacteria bacterium]|nr:30S ribosomal protein S5 [Candidatus Azambacteria bacterium]